MSRKDAYRVGIRLIGIYFAAQCLTGLGYAFSAYWSSAMMSAAAVTSESVWTTVKFLPSNFAYVVTSGLAALLLLSKAEAIAGALERSDRRRDGEPHG